MISTLDRTIKLGILLSVIDWLTFNVVFLLSFHLNWFPLPDWKEHFTTYLVTANIAYAIALQAVTISLHHRMSQPANVLRNTSRTSLIFIILYTSFLGVFTDASVPGVKASLFMLAILFIVTSVERLILRTYIIRLRTSGRNTVKTVILGTGGMAQKVADIMTDNWTGYELFGLLLTP